MNNIAYERVIMQVNAVQDYIESLDSMPRTLQKNLVNDLDMIVADLDYYGNVIQVYNNDSAEKLRSEFVRKHEEHWERIKKMHPESYHNVFVDEFANDYDKSITKAKAKLDDMFKENDDG